MAGDRLSNLSDDLLHRVLHFTPLKEAASTSALARRWRSVWRSSDAINLDTRSHVGYDSLGSKQDVFLGCADGALAGHDDDYPVRKLTVHVEGEDDIAVKQFMSRNLGQRYTDILTHVLSHPAARRVEELCVKTPAHHHYGLGRTYYLCIITCLPYEALRVLDMSHARLTSSALPVAFPRLETIRLHQCDVRRPLDLQDMIDAAPMLATLHLEGVYFEPYNFNMSGRPYGRLRFPKVTTLVLANINWWDGHLWGGPGKNGVELDTPMLRCFRYEGLVRPIRLMSPTPDIARVDLHFFRKQDCQRRTKDEIDDDRLFLQFVDNFSNAKVWNVTGDHLPADMIAAGKKRGLEILATGSSNVQSLLELQAYDLLPQFQNKCLNFVLNVEQNWE